MASMIGPIQFVIIIYAMYSQIRHVIYIKCNHVIVEDWSWMLVMFWHNG
jgi:hypothetical protein